MQEQGQRLIRKKKVKSFPFSKFRGRLRNSQSEVSDEI